MHSNWICRRCAEGRINLRGPSPYERRVAKIQKHRDRLLGLDGAGPARGLNRERIAAALLEDPLTTKHYPNIEPLLRQQEKRATSRKRKAASQPRWPELTTKHALALGFPVSPPATQAAMLKTGFLYVDGALVPEVPSVAESEVGILEQHPSLDVRVLSREWKREESGRWAHTLGWPEALRISEMLIVAELVDAADPHVLVITQPRSMSKMIQKIALLPVPAAADGTRWFFICGLTGKRCELLSLRNDFFASPKAQRLVHQSQRALTRGL